MLPQFQCIKKVRAGKIINILNLDNGLISLTLHTGTGEPHIEHVTPAFMAQHRPEVNGYYVKYDSGYESYSPGVEFEKGYVQLPAFVPF